MVKLIIEENDPVQEELARQEEIERIMREKRELDELRYRESLTMNVVNDLLERTRLAESRYIGLYTALSWVLKSFGSFREFQEATGLANNEANWIFHQVLKE